MKKHMKKLCLVALAAAFAAGCSDNKPETRGVTDTEIILGGMHDLSGVFAAFSTPAIRAAQMHFDEVNKAGGIHGRTIRYIVEDHAYQVPRAVQATNKLVTRDNIFAMFMSLGTPHNLAAFPVMDRNDVPSILPLSLARQMESEGDYSRRFVFGPSYYEAVGAGVEWITQEHGINNLCAMYIPSDFGQELNQAFIDAAAKHEHLTLKESTSHRPDESDFTGALSRLRAANCQLVGVALAIRPIISVAAAARDMGWTDVKFLVSQAGFHNAVAGAPGNVTEGLYTVAAWQDLHTRMDNPETAAWVEKYRATYNEAPTTGSTLGINGAAILVKALEKAGRDLTVDSLVAALESLDFVEPITGVHMKMSKEKHQAATGVHISRVENGLWTPVVLIE